MNDDEQFRQLVDRWEDLHEQGQEVSVEGLCRDHPHLEARLRKWVRLLRATDWLCKPLSDGGGPTGRFNGAATAKDEQPRPVTTDEFLKNLADSGLLPSTEIDSLRPAALDADTLAAQLVDQGKLTQYQADCVLQGKTKHLVLGEYTILDVLGSGGMGRVFRARHRRMNRVVALKVLPPSAMDCAESIGRFQREIQAVAKLSHPNIVAAHDAGSCDGMHYFAMDLIEGQDLGQCAKEHGPLPVEQAVDCVLQVARGLEYAHGQGIIHRDVKPSNLMLDEGGTVKILDLGVARFHAASLEADLTDTGCLLGTVDYMAPEQAINTKLADHRADIYSLGCTLYFLLTGQIVYDGETAMERLLAHREHTVPSLKRACPAVPHWLDIVFERMVAKKPEARFQSMSEVIAALERQTVPRSKPRWLRFAFLGGVAVAVVVAMVLFRRAAQEPQHVVPASVQAPSPSKDARNEEIARTTTAIQPPALPLEKPVSHETVPQPILVPRPQTVSLTKDQAIEWVMRNGGQIETFTRKKKRNASQSSFPPSPNSIRSIKLHGNKALSDDDLANLAPLTSLQELNFRYCRFTGVGFRHLVGLANLRDLTLGENAITDEGLKEIGKLAQVTTLILSDNRAITNDGLQHLAGMTHLASLALSRTRVTDGGLRHLQGLTNLTTLALLNTSVTDAGLEYLKGLHSLMSLDVGKTNVTREGLRRLKTHLPQCQLRE